VDRFQPTRLVCQMNRSKASFNASEASAFNRKLSLPPEAACSLAGPPASFVNTPFQINVAFTFSVRRQLSVVSRLRLPATDH
jgi:hypothetical protein